MKARGRMDIIDDYKQLRMIEALKEYNNMKVCYKENLELCKCQEQQINRLATAIEKIAKIIEGTYEALDPQALQEIRQIIKEQTHEK
jgi:hypothetical protein